MKTPVSATRPTFDLPLDSYLETKTATGVRKITAVSPIIFAQNAKWFCQLRWIVVTFMITIGIVSLSSFITEWSGLRIKSGWPFLIALVGTTFNVAYLFHIQSALKKKRVLPLRINIWVQIIIDLLMLTVVVHYVGSIETFAPFAFLFHIVLACIFFSRIESFIVLLISCVFYSACLISEIANVIPANVLFLNLPMRQNFNMASLIIQLASVFGIWGTVWYLGARLATMLQKREMELAQTNAKLICSQIEKSKHMLRTTHELKAPFAAIHANLQLLLKGYCGELGNEAVEVLKRISARAERLSHSIQEMLQLSNLNNFSKEDSTNWGTVNLTEILKKCIQQLKPVADQRSVTVKQSLGSMEMTGSEDHLTMLFSNLLSNAVSYSELGGTVEVFGTKSENGYAKIVVEDHGIGIAPEKLPRIFDEYYRTEEGAVFNKNSTGLGLAIVRQVAELYRIRITVESVLGEGTKFISLIPINSAKK